MSPDDLAVQIGTRVRILRNALGLNQKDLSDHLRLSRPSITNIEAGRQGNLPVTTLVGLAQILETTVGTLLGEQPMPNVPDMSIRTVRTLLCGDCGPVCEIDTESDAEAIWPLHVRDKHLGVAP